MQNKILGLLITLLVAGWANVAGAALVDNGITTIDTNTGLEWLDITETNGLSYNEVLSSSYVVSDGYRFASKTEIFELFANAGGIGTDTTEFRTENKGPSTLLLQLMGCTSYLISEPCDGIPEEWSPAMWGESSQFIGLIDDFNDTVGILTTNWSVHGNDDTSFRADVGAFLVRVGYVDSEPVPSISAYGIGLAIFMLLLVGGFRLRATGRRQ